jgi:hypothetical protein
MLAKKSPLILETFFMVENRFKFIQPNDDIQNLQTELFDQYEIDLDFTIRLVSEENAPVITFNVFTKMGINQQKQPLDGYSMFVEGVGVYNLSRESLSDKDVENLMSLSALSIMINCLRGVLMDYSSNAPLGRYILPSIDVNDLLKQKSNKGKRKAKVKKVIEE